MTMDFCVYILYSQSLDKFYIGQTVDLENRFEQHVSHSFAGSFTTHANDWSVFLTIECSNRKQALLIEAHIKKMKSKVYIQNLKKFPSLREKLIAKYSTPDC